MQVYTQFVGPPAVFHNAAAVSALEQRTDPAVFPVMPHAVARGDPLHCPAQVAFRGLRNQVIVLCVARDYVELICSFLRFS